MTNLTDRIDRAIADCPRCNTLTGDARETRRAEVLRDVERVRTREPMKLGIDAWPLGRPPKEQV